MISYGDGLAVAYCDRCYKLVTAYIGGQNLMPSPYDMHLCPECTKKFNIENLITNEVKEIMNEKAKRENISVRYDLLVPEFLHELARLASHGAEKYGDRNWQASRLVGGKSPLNHLHEHLNAFQSGKDHDFFEEKRGHLVAVAFNAMMEWWYESNFPDKL